MIVAINSTEHGRIIADMERVSLIAGVQERFVKQSMSEYCSPEEIDWVKQFNKYRTEGVPGLVLEGVHNPDTRCQAIAGAFIRNFIDARVMPLNQVLELQEGGAMPSPTVLLIPNLFMVSVMKNVPVWKVQIVYDLLLQRSVQNKPSVAYVENLGDLKKTYGVPFGDFLSGFRIVK